MPPFLSPEWIAALDAAAAEVAVPDSVVVTVQQVVRDGPAEVRYHLVFAGGRLRVREGDAPAPDVTMVHSRAAAAALCRGETNAQQALEAGLLKLAGDLGPLARQGRALAALGDVFASVRAATTYPDPVA